MKTLADISRAARPRAGVALVIVLFVVALLVGVVVAFLSSVQTDRATASTFLSTTQVQRMADSVIGIVETQISNAAGKTDASGATEAWISQPGMVRTYNTAGTLDTAYKLYSATTLSLTDPTQVSADLPSATWTGSPAVWSDLNSPVVDNGTTTYPIVDPSGLGTIQGFSINAAAAPGVTSAQPAPMPVRWLYVLKKGEIVAPDASSTGNVATFSGANAPTSSDPIVGRIAFWTDDETCKVDVNTAGAGSTAGGNSTFWDTPHFASTEDYAFANNQPLNGEFQRYPGHPAVTSLNAIFPALNPEDIFTEITPKYQAGGSVEGTVNTLGTTGGMDRSKADKPLRASVDELFFQAGARTPYTPLTRSTLQASKFFLTAYNSAPELNLLNLPRVACWPIAQSATGQTADDKVIAFCSTINQQPYYFQRSSALSSTADAGIGRNTSLYAYLQYLVKQPLPGFGVSLDKKFTTSGVSDSAQILTEIWDYIRCTNLYDSRLTTANTQFTGALANSSGASNVPGLGYVTPLQVASTNTQGFGRAMTLSELAFHFICTADSTQSAPGTTTGLLGSNDPGTTQMPYNLTLSTPLLTTATDGSTVNQRRVQMLILPEFFSPSVGNITMQVPTKSYRLILSGLDSLKLSTTSGTFPLFPSASVTYVLPAASFNGGAVSNARRYGGTLHYCAILGYTFAPTYGKMIDSGATSSYTQYPLISNFATVSAIGASPTMTFGTGALTFEIDTSSDQGAHWTLLQTGTITPPASTSIPVPNLVTDGGTTPAANAHWWAFSYKSPWGAGGTGAAGGRLQRDNSEPDSDTYTSSVTIDPGISATTSSYPGPSTFIRAAGSASTYFDVVRSMEPSHGDYRLIAGLQNVPSMAFTPLGNWAGTGPANALIHTLQEGHGALNYTAGAALYRRHFITTNPIGSALGNSGIAAPDFRTDNAAAVTAVQASGDFDNPMSTVADGAYINKPDEGTTLAGTGMPYYDNGAGYIDANTFFSPNRIMPGPGMFGSLPTHLMRYQADPGNPQLYAWRTLLFRRQPSHPDAAAINSTGLPTSVAPDHLLMDLFWMPTVEPYAISQPFSSFGKVNMNYEIMPFTYIVRKTGLYAVLDNEKIPAVPNTAAVAKSYKTQNASIGASYRQTIDIAQTLTQFDTRFTNADSGGSATGRLFVSPTELCDLWLVPTGQAPDDTTMQTFWNNNALTGDNMRERPYTTIIPRLTTKSNTYTVHFRVQALKLPPQVAPNSWDETKGKVTAEYRGSTTIERFLDPTDTTIPDYAGSASPGTQTPLSTYYHWRVLSNRVFAP